jgi:glycolate oxidase iron-sulfur subunit
MQTRLPEDLKQTEVGREIDAILRSCVHCGFCNATCPTYQLLGDELDGPRGRIYQIKQMLEGGQSGDSTRLHLDRCLTCRNCESTCPSGVEFGRLLDVGRAWVERKHPRGIGARLMRRGLNAVLPYPGRFTPLLRIGQLLRLLLPGGLRRSIPNYRKAGSRPTTSRARKMIALAGCVQSGIAPNINNAAARILDRLGIELVESKSAVCCGSVSHHFNYEDEARDFARKNIDAWWPLVETGAEAIVMTASGCGLHVKDYGHLLRHDKQYAQRANRIANMTKDIAEVVANEDLSTLGKFQTGQRIAFHPPCTLQHGQKLDGVVEKILRDIGFSLKPVQNAHLCCGSAGTYSILQPGISRRLKAAKISALMLYEPHVIVTANIGCQTHLQSATATPVKHWIELLDPGS